MIQLGLRAPVRPGAVCLAAYHGVIAKAVDLVLIQLSRLTCRVGLRIVMFEAATRTGEVELIEHLEAEVSASKPVEELTPLATVFF